MRKKTDSIADEILQKGVPDSGNAGVRDAAMEKSMDTLGHMASPPPPQTKEELTALVVDAVNIAGMGLTPHGHKPSHVQVPALLPADEAFEGKAGEAVLDAAVHGITAIESLVTREQDKVAAGEAVLDAVVRGITAVESLVTKEPY